MKTSFPWPSGKRGQNARLTSRLTGWDINIEKDETAKEAFEHNVTRGAQSLAAALKVPEDLARRLINEGMNSVEVIATGAQPQDIADVLGIDLAKATEVHGAVGAWI